MYCVSIPSLMLGTTWVKQLSGTQMILYTVIVTKSENAIKEILVLYGYVNHMGRRYIT